MTTYAHAATRRTRQDLNMRSHFAGLAVPIEPVRRLDDDLDAATNRSAFAADVERTVRELERLAGQPEPSPEPSPEPRGGGSAARDLDALARVLPVLDGSAMPLLRIPGGQQDGSPAERVQPLLGPALRAVHRLAWLREHGRYEHVLVLLATHCYAGETRRDRSWPDTVRLALLPRELRVRTMAAAPVAAAPSKGPDAAAARTAGARLLAEAEDAYRDAGELGSDGRWLAEDLDAVSRLITAVEADRLALAAKARPASDERIVSRCRTGRAVSCAGASAEDECVLGRPRRARAPGSQTWELLAGTVTR
jgi:hypothetical protein